MSAHLNGITIEILAALFIMSGWYIMASFYHSSSRLRDKVLASLAFGIAVSAYTITIHLPIIMVSNSPLNSGPILYSFIIPAIGAFIAINITRFSTLAQSVLLAFGVVGSHIAISNGHTAPQWSILFASTMVLLWLALAVLTTSFSRLAFCSPRCRYGVSIFIVSIGLVLLSLMPDPEFRPHLNGQHHVDALYALLSAAGLILLYLQMILSITKGLLSLWRVLFAIMAAEFGIMFLLPPLLGDNSPEWLASLIDGSLLSIFVFPLLWQQHRISQGLSLAHAEIKTTLLAIKDGVIVCDKKGIIRYFNRTAEGLTGLMCIDVIGQPIADVIHIYNEIDHQPMVNPVIRCLQEKTVVELANHTVIELRDGSTTAIEHSASPIFDSQSQLAGAIVICRDATQRRQRQQKQKQEKELHLLLNTLLSLDLNSLTIKQLLQTALEKVLAFSWLPVQAKGGVFLAENNDHLRLVAQCGLSDEVSHHCALIEFGHCLCGQVAQSQSVIHKSCLDPDHEFQHEGMHDHGHYSIPLLSGNKTLGVMVLYLDEGHVYNAEELDTLITITTVITHLLEKKKAIKTMSLSHQVIQNSHQGIMICNADNKIISINPAFTDITGYT